MLRIVEVRAYYDCLREAAKKNPPLMARQVRPNPPPSSLMAIRFFLDFFFSLKIAENGF